MQFLLAIPLIYFVVKFGIELLTVIFHFIGKILLGLIVGAEYLIGGLLHIVISIIKFPFNLADDILRAIFH